MEGHTMTARYAMWSAVVGILLAAAAGAARGAGPAISAERIEADWLRQDELRGRAAPRAGQAGPPATAVKPEEDAAGGVDGRINGQWGFHTENQDKPWWQVDLGASQALDSVVLYNRCDGDGAFAGRNAHIMVLLSEDGKKFEQVYQHDGKTFLGFTDKKPLIVDLKSAKGRFLRLQLPDKNYFHLDEVQVYAAGGKDNIALGRPATQSSVSEWSAVAKKAEKTAPTEKTEKKTPGTAVPGLPGENQPKPAYPTALAIERGLKLAANLKAMGAKIDAYESVLREAADKLAALPAGAPDAARRELYMKARWAVRRMALANPLLDFDEVLFVKRAPTLLPHLSDQYYGWFSRGGGGIYVLSGFKGDQPALRCLTEKFETGNFLRPDISYDGKKVLFAWCKFYPQLAGMGDKTQKDKISEDAFYHIFEMNADGTGVRQLTRGAYDDFDGRYLPNGEIVFMSTRKGTALQAGRDSAAATMASPWLPDSYVRCGGGRSRPVAVFTLHRMAGDGGNLRAISAFENFEWTPAVANDGRVLYTRWDYIDRFNGPIFSLWSTNPDGTNPQLVYGNYTARPNAVFEARAIPNSDRMVFTASAHHSITGGSLVMLDRNAGTEYEGPLTRLTPEIPFPEGEGSAPSYYLNPWPLSEEHYLCSWADRPLPPHAQMSASDPRNPPNAAGVYLYDAFGNLNLLHRDPDISSTDPIPLRPRSKPPVIADMVDWSAPQDGRFLVQDVYEGLTGVQRGTVARLRIVGVPPKVQPEMNSPAIGVSAEDPGKFVLGTVAVEADGSAYFRVPSGVPVFFQALGRDGLAVQTMRTLTYVQPGQTLSCVGCHESRDAAPALARSPMALRRGPAKLTAEPSGSWPLRFDELVQPVLDKQCVSCHKADAKDPKGAKFDLTAPKAYQSLLTYAGGDLKKLAFEKDRSIVNECPARKSKLMGLLTAEKGHEGVRLDAVARYRLAVWMDTYAQVQGSFSKQQEDDLRQFRQKMAGLIEE
jgi:hypothetical protein